MTEELAEAIARADTLQALDDLYLSFRPRRRTRASIAREKGLEPPARRMMAQEDAGGDPVAIAASLLPEEQQQEIEPEEALAGARDILTEWISEDREVRSGLRKLMCSDGTIAAQEDGSGPSVGLRHVLRFHRVGCLSELVRTLYPVLGWAALVFWLQLFARSLRS